MMRAHVCFQQTPSGGRTCAGRMPGVLEVRPHASVAPGVPASKPAARRADRLTPRGGETRRLEALPRTDAVCGSGGQAPVPGAPLDGCKTSWPVSQHPGSLSIFVNPDGKSCWRCDGCEGRSCGEGSQCDSAHAGDGERPAPVTVPYTRPPDSRHGAVTANGKRGGAETGTESQRLPHQGGRRS